MTPRRAAMTALLVLLAALVWAPLGASSLGWPSVAVAATASHLPVIDPEASPSAGQGSAAPAPVASPAPTATPFPAPAASPVAAATPIAAPVASAVIVARAVPSAAKPAASPEAAGKSASPATLRSATPAASSRPRTVASPALSSARPASGQPGTPDQSATRTMLLAALTGLAVGSLLMLLGRRRPQADRPVLAAQPVRSGTGGPDRGSAAGPDGGPMLERRRSAGAREGGVERRRSARLQPADDPILSAMGLGVDAPAAGGARAVRARARRVRQGLEPHAEDERPT